MEGEWGRSKKGVELVDVEIEGLTLEWEREGLNREGVDEGGVDIRGVDKEEFWSIMGVIFGLESREDVKEWGEVSSVLGLPTIFREREKW
jgi:hypothetical protein